METLSLTETLSTEEPEGLVVRAALLVNHARRVVVAASTVIAMFKNEQWI